MRFIMSLGKASCMVYTEALFLLHKAARSVWILLGLQCLGKQKLTIGSWGVLHDAAQVRLPSLEWEEAGHLPMWHDPGRLYQHRPLPHPVTRSALLSSASCLTEAEPCAPHSSASWVWVSPERSVGEGYGWNWEVLTPLTRFSGWGCKGACSPSGQAISDMLFLLGFCVSLRIWPAVGESSPSLIFLLSRAVGADADETGGWGETPVSTVRAACRVDPRSSYWPW